MNKNRNRGFTLAELLIVIVILGILGGLALPRFFPQAEKGRVAEAVTMLSAIRQGEEAYKLENGSYMTGTITWASLGMDDPNTTTAASRNFTYTIPAVSGNATFVATATRCTNKTTDTWCRNEGGTDYGGDTITLDNTGTWGGTHDHAPN